MKNRIANWLAKIRGVQAGEPDTIGIDGDDLIPSNEVIQRAGIGPSNAVEFVAFGDAMFQSYLIGNARLLPDEKILDAGCGLGQLARPLAKYLSDKGGYEGFDIIADSVNWCTEHYGVRYPHFRFQLADIYNSYYNATGTYKASEYKFPYADEAFDVVLLCSIFTHMLPDEVDNYFSEIARVLKHHGRCVITYFLLNADASVSIERGLSTPKFPHEYGSPSCRVDNPESPEAATGHDEGFIRSLYRKYGLSIERIEYGEWCRRSLTPFDQDTVTASKYS